MLHNLCPIPLGILGGKKMNETIAKGIANINKQLGVGETDWRKIIEEYNKKN